MCGASSRLWQGGGLRTPHDRSGEEVKATLADGGEEVVVAAKDEATSNST